MSAPDLTAVADQVVRRAQRQGHVAPREVREELARAGAPEARWREVVALAGPSLTLRRGRYHYLNPAAARLREEEAARRAVRRAVRSLIRSHRQSARRRERRGEDRLDFIQPAVVTTEDGQPHRLLSRDLSSTGIRLVGTRRLLGQKVRVRLPGDPDGPAWTFVVRVLWTCAVGDDLFENGGTFLSVSQEQDERGASAL